MRKTRKFRPLPSKTLPDYKTKPLFEFHVGEQVMKVWANGYTEGFPADTRIVNRALPIFHAVNRLCQLP